MKNDGSAVWLLLIAIWFFSHNSVSETRHWYTGMCYTGWAKTGLDCNTPKEKPQLDDIKYTVTPSASTVVFEDFPYLPKLLEHCAIIDVENWTCPDLPNSFEVTMKYHCNDRECLMSVRDFEAKDRRQLNFFEYYLLKIRNYLP